MTVPRKRPTPSHGRRPHAARFDDNIEHAVGKEAPSWRRETRWSPAGDRGQNRRRPGGRHQGRRTPPIKTPETGVKTEGRSKQDLKNLPKVLVGEPKGVQSACQPHKKSGRKTAHAPTPSLRVDQNVHSCFAVLIYKGSSKVAETPVPTTPLNETLDVA